MPPASRRRAAIGVLAICAATGLGPLLPAAASAEPRIRVVDYGLYDVERSGRKVEARRTLTGKVDIVRTMRLVDRTHKVLAQLGANFGLRIDLIDFPPGPATLTIRALHPKVTNPETGVARAVSEYDWNVGARQNVYFGYGIRKRWHINEGIWTVQIVYRGKVLAQQKFELIVPLN